MKKPERFVQLVNSPGTVIFSSRAGWSELEKSDI